MSDSPERGPRFEELFKTTNRPRDNHLSRLFGIFAEDIVRHWCADHRAPYEDRGRPSLFSDGVYRGLTLDFTLRHRTSRRVFVAELKSEMAFENYRYLRLRSVEQLRAERRGGAFRAFLDLAKDPTAYEVRLAGRAVRVDGAVLIWGATTPVGRSAAIDRFALADVLSLEGMLADLSAWGNVSWRTRVAELRGWSDELFTFLDP